MVQLKYKAIQYYSSLSFDNNRMITLSENDMEDFKKDIPAYSLKLSYLSYRVYFDIINKAEIDYNELPKASLISQIESTSLSTLHPGIYKLIKMALLEVYSVKYLSSDMSFLDYYSVESIGALRANLRYLGDWLGYYRAYRFLVEYFRDLDIAIGYIQNQLNMVLTSDDLTYSLHEFNDNSYRGV